MEIDRHGGHRPVCHKYLGEKNIHYLYTKICHVISCYAMKASCFKITSALYMVTSLPSFPLVDTHILTRAASLYHTLTLPLSLTHSLSYTLSPSLSHYSGVPALGFGGLLTIVLCGAGHPEIELSQQSHKIALGCILVRTVHFSRMQCRICRSSSLLCLLDYIVVHFIVLHCIVS